MNALKVVFITNCYWKAFVTCYIKNAKTKITCCFDLYFFTFDKEGN